MQNSFFEGKDFRGAKFKALIPDFYPLAYQDYIQEEAVLLKEKLSGAAKILEAGVGIGRVIPDLAPLVGKFVGIDNAELMLREAEKISTSYSNVNIIKGDLENIDELFPANSFDYSLCIWNTLGNVEDEPKVLEKLSHVTRGSIFITTYLKGTLEQRKNWYETVGIPIKMIDQEREIFYSESGLQSRSYSAEDMMRIAWSARLEVKDSRILAGVMLWTELRKKNF